MNTAILCELLNAAYLALFSGVPHLALKAIEVIHQRAQYEMLPNVLLVSFRNWLPIMNLASCIYRRIGRVRNGGKRGNKKKEPSVNTEGHFKS